MVGGDSRVYTSTNATTWTAYNFLAGDPNLSAGSVLYSNGKYLAFGTGRSKTSTDAINWTDITSGPTSDLGLGIGGLAYGNGIYLCSTSSATQFFTSTDAYNWVSISPKTARFARIIYNNGLFVGTASDGGVNLGTSTDGINWTTRYTGTTSYTHAIVYANGLYVYVADGGAVGTSTDAITPVFSTSYDISTQFFVPGYTTGSRFYTTPSYGGNTSARFINYVRAK